MAKSSRNHSSKGRPLRRKPEDRAPRRTFLVFCEGIVTEPLYLRALEQELAREMNAPVRLEISKDSGAVPLTLVTKAVEARARSDGKWGEIDEVWCIFDVEWPQNHPDLKEARALAERSEVKVAVSNPCFELWLLLHFQDQTAWLDTNAVKRRLKEHDSSEGKSLDGATYMPRRAEAATRARSLEARHKGNGTKFPDDNPSSGMYLFLNAIEQPEGLQRGIDNLPS